jgi:hypothetical protein
MAHSLEHTAHSPQLTAHSLEHTAHSPQPTAHSTQPTAHSPQPRAHSPQPTAQSTQPTAHSLEHSVFHSLSLCTDQETQQVSQLAHDLRATEQLGRRGRLKEGQFVTGLLLTPSLLFIQLYISCIVSTCACHSVSFLTSLFKTFREWDGAGRDNISFSFGEEKGRR